MAGIAERFRGRTITLKEKEEEEDEQENEKKERGRRQRRCAAQVVRYTVAHNREEDTARTRCTAMKATRRGNEREEDARSAKETEKHIENERKKTRSYVEATWKLRGFPRRFAVAIGHESHDDVMATMATCQSLKTAILLPLRIASANDRRRGTTGWRWTSSREQRRTGSSGESEAGRRRGREGERGRSPDASSLDQDP